MTLEEAIKHCNEVAKENEKQFNENPEQLGYDEHFYNCQECAKEHRQLAEWLRELEWRRNAMVEIHEAMLMPSSMAERISKEVNTDEMDN